jgi:hypothetical protein
VQAELQQGMAAIRDALASLDKTLVDAADNAGSKMQHQWKVCALAPLVPNCDKVKSPAVTPSNFSNALFPNKTLQSARSLAFISCLATVRISVLCALPAE